MTAVLTGPDISAGHGVPKLDGQAFIGFRETLGTAFVDRDFAAQYAEVMRTDPAIVTLGYAFLTGPGRNVPMDAQMHFWAQNHRCELAALDWESDVIRNAQGKVIKDFGRQPFSGVLRGIDVARSVGINPGVYLQRSLATPAVLDALIGTKHVPFLWIAAFDGLQLEPEQIAACRKAGIPLLHQFTGAELDRSNLVVGTLDDLHRIAGRPVAPPEEESSVARFISASGYNPASLPTIAVPAGTVVRDLAGTAYGSIGPTSLYTDGLVDGHSTTRSVLIRTGRYFADRQARPVWQSVDVAADIELAQPNTAKAADISNAAITASLEAIPLAIEAAA